MADQSFRSETESHGRGFKNLKCAPLEPLCHVTATEPVADNLASVPISKSSGQIEFVYENPGADSLQFDEPIRLYPCTLCHVKCRRPYDLERHKQTKHSQSQHWFCPFDTCKLSRAVPGLSEAIDASYLRYSNYWCRTYRRPLTHEQLHTEYGCAKVRLHGFSRRDKLTKHIKKAHQEEILGLGATPYGKGLSHTQSLVCEIQLFWAHCGTDVPDPGQKWSPTSLCRSQVDGKWSEFAGRDLKAVAEAGFRRWTKADDESYRRLVQTGPEFYEVLPWKAHDLILELGDGFNHPDDPMYSASAERSIPASSSGCEDSPWSTANTQVQSLPNIGVEETFAAFDWEAFLNSDLNSGIDMETVASNHADLSAFDINGPESSFDFNYSALNNAAATEFDFDFNDPSSLSDWYFSAENGAEPDV